jgi:hypothetical protein
MGAAESLQSKLRDAAQKSTEDSRSAVPKTGAIIKRRNSNASALMPLFGGKPSNQASTRSKLP